MAYYHIFPKTDTTIYSHPDRLHLNTGRDEILEVVKEKGTSDQKHYPSRVLIRFGNEDLTEVIQNIIGSEDFNTKTTCSIELTSTEPKNLTHILNLQAYAVSQSWQEGSGRYSNLPTGSDGASWLQRNGSTTYENRWFRPGAGVAYSSIYNGTNNNDGTVGGFEISNYTEDPTGTPSYLTPGTTGSISSSAITHGGGTWYTGSGFVANQQFLYGDSLDINIDVTNIITKHSASLFSSQTYPDGIENYGFLIKQPDTVEANTTSSFGEMQYFSVETKTIFPPTLTFKWDDSVHKKQKKAKQSGPLNVHLYNNQPEYNQNDITTFRVHVRDKYPTREFSTTSNYLKVGYLTTSSYYSIRDAHTEEEIIPFDSNTKMSADNDGMFFKIYMKGLQPERYYRMLFKHKNNEGTTIYDNDYYFKIVR